MNKTLVQMLRGHSITTRMWGVVGVVLLMLALVGTVGVVGGARIKALNDDFMTGTVQGAQQISNVRLHLARVRLLEKQMVIDYEDGVAVLKHREAWALELAAVQQGLNGLLQGPADASHAPAREALERLASYAKRSEGVLTNIQNGGYDNARVADRMLAKAKEDVHVVEQRMDGIVALASADAAQTQQQFRRAMLQVLLAFVATVVVVVAVVVPLTLVNARSITEPIAHAASVAEGIAGGDLSRTIHVDGRDEPAALLAALRRMQDSLRDVVGEVRQSSLSIQQSSAEVASGNGDLSQRTEQAASSLQQTASSMEQLTGTVRQSADSAQQASQLASSAASVAQRGGSVVAQVVSTMNDINTSSKRIADIIGTIDGIAFQTNILALNAAVEAARAGEQGRGFAVVAGEVRSLAQRSAEAAREIKSLIGASVDRVQTGSRLVADAGSTMREIVDSVQRVNDIIGAISAAAAEQSSGIGQISGAVTDLDHMTQQNAALVEQSAAAAESLKDQAQRLGGLVGSFKLQAA